MGKRSRDVSRALAPKGYETSLRLGGQQSEYSMGYDIGANPDMWDRIPQSGQAPGGIEPVETKLYQGYRQVRVTSSTGEDAVASVPDGQAGYFAAMHAIREGVELAEHYKATRTRSSGVTFGELPFAEPFPITDEPAKGSKIHVIGEHSRVGMCLKDRSRIDAAREKPFQKPGRRVAPQHLGWSESRMQGVNAGMRAIGAAPAKEPKRSALAGNQLRGAQWRQAYQAVADEIGRDTLDKYLAAGGTVQEAMKTLGASL